MKNRSYANRGATLEAFMKFANDRYRQKGIAYIQKIATEFIPLRDRTGKLVSCKVEEKASFDFLGRYGWYPIAIEAKNTNSSLIRFDRVEENQAKDMDDFCQLGTIGLVVVSFNMRRFFAIPWAFWSKAYDVRVRKNDKDTPITIKAYDQTWTVPKKYSVNIDDLLPEWEIPDHDYTFGLDYLKNASKYIFYADQQP